MIMLDEKLGITSDAHNLILIENPKPRKDSDAFYGKHHYFPSFKLMARTIADLKGREFLAMGMPDSNEKTTGNTTDSPQIQHLDAVISGYCDYLQKHLEKITRGEK